MLNISNTSLNVSFKDVFDMSSILLYGARERTSVVFFLSRSHDILFCSLEIVF